MDPRRDIDISGNRVVNVSDPTENDHAATKHYVDTVHTMTPADNVHEYTRYINLRRYINFANECSYISSSLRTRRLI